MTLRPLHDLLVRALHLERRFEPYFRRPLDALTREPLAAVLQWLINARRRNDGLAIAEEREQPGEADDLQSIIDTIRAHMAQDFAPGRMERGGQTKTHGVVRGELTVHDGLPAHLRHGLFAQARSFPAWIRFSNPGPHVEPDIHDVGFGSIAVKLMGVPDPKLLDDEKFTQDLTAGTSPTFVTGTARHNVRLQYWSKRHLGLWYFLDPRDSHILDMLMQALWNEAQRNPLAATYYSAVAYGLGEGQAMQYRFVPKQPLDLRIPGAPFRIADNYLREAMARTLASQSVAFDMRLQLQTDPHLLPVEDGAVRWSDRLSPPVSVATLTIPAQRFDTPAQFEFAKVLSFNPWHSLAEHRPLGNLGRARRRIYRELAEYRQAMNGTPHVEPTGDEVFN